MKKDPYIAAELHRANQAVTFAILDAEREKPGTDAYKKAWGEVLRWERRIVELTEPGQLEHDIALRGVESAHLRVTESAEERQARLEAERRVELRLAAQQPSAILRLAEEVDGMTAGGIFGPSIFDRSDDAIKTPYHDASVRERDEKRLEGDRQPWERRDESERRSEAAQADHALRMARAILLPPREPSRAECKRALLYFALGAVSVTLILAILILLWRAS